MDASFFDAFSGLSISRGSHDTAPIQHQSITDEARKLYIDAVNAAAECNKQGRESDDWYLRAKQVAAAANILLEVEERAAIDEVIELGGPRQRVVGEMLVHFDAMIKSIGRKIFKDNENEDPRRIMWKIAEKCYMEACDPSGELQSEDYFVTIDEARQEWPYDPDFESEEYYEHENLMDNDENYASLYFRNRERMENRRMQLREEENQSWTEFWAQSLQRCRNGPTLFRFPVAENATQSPFNEVPRYLFRAFDKERAGENDETIVSSARELSGSTEEVGDLLALPPSKAADMLHRHLTGGCFTFHKDDNLVSWSSSLLFVVQYAIWRAYKRRRPWADVYICAVDTSKFPPGQFAQDMPLIEVFVETPGLSDEARCFFNFRLKDSRYYNGEYLSQGVLNHAGRSSTFTLQKLKNRGLCELYPELDEPDGMREWANRVLDLRRLWLKKAITTQKELGQAFNIAVTCFGSILQKVDIMVLLLTFRNRKLRNPGMFAPSYSRQVRSSCGIDSDIPHTPETMKFVPVEVSRYMELSELVKMHQKISRPVDSLDPNLLSWIPYGLSLLQVLEVKDP